NNSDEDGENGAPDELPEVRAHPSQLTQVLVNLLINAADAVDGEEEEGGCVELRATVGESEVRLSVADDGVGLDEEEQNRIFDPFYTTKEPGEGTGLGLAIAHRIMDRFGGDIRVRSEPGEGATFVLAFERADRET
ncbi:MAG: sensor histidine kinase, partial [Bradymonadaceae bacterium]